MTRRALDNFVGFTSAGGVRHQPGLDGIRGLAVAAVVLFHSGLDVLPGGYLGVSLFFTLSGVVIGTVVLQEIDSTGRFSLRMFWARRARRLLAAAWLVLAVVAVARPATERLAATSRGDVAASWLHVANWHFLVEEASYRDIFEGPSALLHFWSLAIEEQFYLAVGVLAVVIATASRRPANLLGAVAGAGAVASFILPFLFGFSVDRVYYGTDTRAGELLVGLVVAALLFAPRRRRWLVRRGRVVAVGGLAALAATIGLWIALPPAAPALRLGLLPAVATLSAMMTLAAMVPRGLVWRIATMPPVQELGRISYGLYLIHWPLFVVTEWAIPAALPRALVVVPLSIVLAELSLRFVELPVRRRTFPAAPTMAAATVVAVVIVTALVMPERRSRADELLDELEQAAPLMVPATAPSTTTSTTTTSTTTTTTTTSTTTSTTITTTTTAPSTTTAGRGAGGSRGRPGATTTTGARRATTTTRPPPTTTTTTTTTTTAPPRPATTTPAPPPPDVALFGDSIALSLSLALRHAGPDAAFRHQAGVTDIGCGVALSPFGASGDVDCAGADERSARAVRRNGIDVAVVVSCQWELVAQRLPGDDVERIVGDSVFDQYLRREFLAEIANLRAAGARRVLWVRCPRFSPSVGVAGLDPRFLASRDPARVDRLNQIVAAIAAERDDVAVLDLARWVERRRDDADLRPDGSHYEFERDTGVGAALARLIEDKL